MEINVDFSKGDVLKVVHKPSNTVLVNEEISSGPSEPSVSGTWTVSSGGEWWRNSGSGKVDSRATIDGDRLELLGNNAVGWWSMDNDTDTDVYDLTSLGNDGTMNGGMGTDNYVSGKFGTALEFDGSDDYINVENLGALAVVLNWLHTPFG